MREILYNVLLLSLIAFVLVGIYAVLGIQRSIDNLSHSVNRSTIELNGTLKQVKETVFEIRGAAKAQRETLESLDGQRAQKQWLAAGAQLNTALYKVQSQLIPSLETSSNELALMIRHSDKSVQGLAAELTESVAGSAEDLHKYLERLTRYTSDLIEAGTLSVKEGNAFIVQANQLLADPSIKATLKNIEKSSDEVNKSAQNVTATTANLQGASEHLPKIATDIQAFTKNQSKYGKLVILARIIRAIAM